MSAPTSDEHRPRRQARSFSKKAPEVRRQELIDATFRCLCNHGSSEISVRLIAAEAGVSLGMVRHHFRTKDELLAATLQQLSDKVQSQTREALALPDLTPTERLHAFITACLHPGALDAKYVRARFLFWSLAQTNETIRTVHDRIYARFEKELRGLVGAVAEEKGLTVDLDIVTLAIMALLKGIWVEWSLAPDRADPLKLAEQILPGLDGTFASLAGSARQPSGS
ncbi:TetR family transcriptional regulator C-terminal domain-containing protein [Marivibrio halodurans]|uniref:TetR family transcriptional regulator C-terminal domain-containing protein n=1 Tax=Marivibrio halodurans TaxID=2039722 RepID=A0A8J7S445_9PROT|nr:TetR/AcrR family transcriptional regulator [Marivibrio halodurans]MBP5858374.1 TetR family transcriptional regulator C-terminal domain-containing protein [Marivibrio halodurans]